VKPIENVVNIFLQNSNPRVFYHKFISIAVSFTRNGDLTFFCIFECIGYQVGNYNENEIVF
ncbi:MAG TPA: hypothetical protein PKV50_07545, partial [Prolixibacteraceae bacterium]|nr:hypothetical protein [Prolixibacteraceae bacterium]